MTGEPGFLTGVALGFDNRASDDGASDDEVLTFDTDLTGAWDGAAVSLALPLLPTGLAVTKKMPLVGGTVGTSLLMVGPGVWTRRFRVGDRVARVSDWTRWVGTRVGPRVLLGRCVGSRVGARLGSK